MLIDGVAPRRVLRATETYMTTMGPAARPDLRVVKRADAAPDNWTFFDTAIPLGASAIDIFHAADQLGSVLTAGLGVEGVDVGVCMRT